MLYNYVIKMSCAFVVWNYVMYNDYWRMLCCVTNHMENKYIRGECKKMYGRGDMQMAFRA